MSESERKHKSKHKSRSRKRRIRRRIKQAALIVVVLVALVVTAWLGNNLTLYGTLLPQETKPASTIQFSSENSEAVYRAVEREYPASVARDCLKVLESAGFGDILTDVSMDAGNVIHATTDDAFTIDVTIQIDAQQQIQIYITHVSPKAILTMSTDIRFAKDQDHYTACLCKGEIFGVYDREKGAVTAVADDQLVIAFDESMQNPSVDISQPGFIKDNPIVVPVDEFVEEINTDLAAAKAKYDGKYIKVTADIKEAVVGGTITKYYIYGKQEETGLRIVCWQDGDSQEIVKEGRTYAFLGRIREISLENVTEITECEIQLEEDVNRAVIEISSADQIYALSRILQTSAVHTHYISKDITYDILNDFAVFTYPEDVATVAEKTEYLRTASYKLVEDIEINLQKSAGAEYFTGIGSADKVFKGTFDGNGKTITMTSKGEFDFSGISDYGTGLFDETESANIRNLTVNVVSDIKIIATTGLNNVGIIVGDADNTVIENCKVVITNAVVGAEYRSTQNVPTNIGGIAGTSTFTTFKNCQVVLENATLKGTGSIVNPTRDYGGIAVGGILGFSGAGSNNSENIGKLGNQLYNCTLTSRNDVQTDAIIATIETGKELTVGGIVGCTFNNILVENCSVDVEKGNISAVKTGTSDGAIFGTQAGGIIGRMEHTGEVTGCSVLGDYLTILSKSPNNVTCAGGVVGIDMGPYHRDIHTINNSYFDGAGTSNIRVEITSTDTLIRDKIIAAGGIVGSGAYIVSDCSVKNVTITNNTANIGNPTTYVGEIAGFISLRKTADIYGTGYNWFYNTYFKKRNPGLYDCFSEHVNVVKTDNVQNLMY